MKILTRYFMRGLLFLVPIGLTIFILFWLFQTIDQMVQSAVMRAGGGQLPGWWRTGLGFLGLVVVIFLAGVLSSLFVTRPLMVCIEKLLGRLPLVKLMYSSLKDLVGAFVGEKKKFDQPVLVTLIAGGAVQALGFITRQSLEFLGCKDHVAVYLPQSYNFAGSVLVVPRDQVHPIKADSSDVMAFIVSGGVSGVKELAGPSIAAEPDGPEVKPPAGGGGG